MTHTLSLICICGTLLLALGCAATHHSDPGCYVDCHYCPPPPLPYTQYDECVCHSRAAEPYLYSAAVTPEQDEAIEPPQRLELDDPEDKSDSSSPTITEISASMLRHSPAEASNRIDR